MPTERSSISVSGSQRNAPEKIAEQQMNEQLGFGWRGDNQLAGYIISKYKLAASGVGFLTHPYTALWDLVWGATPIEDLGKYKDLSTRIPYIAACERVKSSMVISNGFELQGGKDDVRKWLQDWCDNHNILQTLRVVSWDMLVFGNAYLEICRDDKTIPENWWLKPLDPVHIRVRRDQYGNIFGYIQLLTFPPVPFTAQEIVHFINEPKSNWYECSYGTSELRPLLLIQAYIDSFERDMATIIGVYLKPMFVVKGGRPENPYTDGQLNTLMDVFSDRRPNTDIFVRGDVTVEQVESLTRTINFTPWLDYLERQRKAILGVPEIFLGEPSGTNRATADTVMAEYLTRLRMLQKIIGDNLETMLFAELLAAKFGPGTEVPKIRWKPIWNSTLQELTPYYSMLTQTGSIGVGELRLAAGLPEKMPSDAGTNQVASQAQSGGSGTVLKLGNQATYTKDGKTFLVAEILAPSA